MKTKMILMSILITLVVMPLASFANGEGTNSGGGGDPLELLQESIRVKNSKTFQYQNERSFRREFRNQVQVNYSFNEIKKQFNNWVNQTVLIYSLLKEGGTFESDSVFSQITATDIQQSLTSANFQVDGELQMEGPNKKPRRVLFISDPVTQKISLNLIYWREIMSVADFNFGDKLPDPQKVAQYIVELASVNRAITGILIHEALVLKSFEQSRDYTHSSRFVLTSYMALNSQQIELNFKPELQIYNTPVSFMTYLLPENSLSAIKEFLGKARSWSPSLADELSMYTANGAITQLGKLSAFISAEKFGDAATIYINASLHDQLRKIVKREDCGRKKATIDMRSLKRTQDYIEMTSETEKPKSAGDQLVAEIKLRDFLIDYQNRKYMDEADALVWRQECPDYR